jgi:hypothetical protein
LRAKRPGVALWLVALRRPSRIDRWSGDGHRCDRDRFRIDGIADRRAGDCSPSDERAGRPPLPDVSPRPPASSPGGAPRTTRPTPSGTTTVHPQGWRHVRGGHRRTAFSFDGSSQYVEVSSAPNLQLKRHHRRRLGGLAERRRLRAGIAGMGRQRRREPHLPLLALQRQARVHLAGPPSLQRASDPAPLPVDRWTHVAGTYDGATISIYVDGVEAGHAPMTGDMATTTRPFTIGRTDGGSVGRPNCGWVDRRADGLRPALSATEIASIQAAGSAGKCSP